MSGLNNNKNHSTEALKNALKAVPSKIKNCETSLNSLLSYIESVGMLIKIDPTQLRKQAKKIETSKETAKEALNRISGYRAKEHALLETINQIESDPGNASKISEIYNQSLEEELQRRSQDDVKFDRRYLDIEKAIFEITASNNEDNDGEVEVLETRLADLGNTFEIKSNASDVQSILNESIGSSVLEIKVEPQRRLEEESDDENQEMELDLEIVEETIALIDPLTKKSLVNPIRNKKCKHWYESSTLIEYATNIKAKNKRAKVSCPHFACLNDAMSAAQFEDGIIPKGLLAPGRTSKGGRR